PTLGRSGCASCRRRRSGRIRPAREGASGPRAGLSPPPKQYRSRIDLSPARNADTGPKEEVEMNLEQLRKQAKELVRAARAGEPEALERLGGREPILARAQLVLAREHGYASWPALVAAAEANV